MSDEYLSRSPEPEEVLRSAITYFLDDVHTCLPARVEVYDPATQKISAKPLIKRRIITEENIELLEELPIIPDVPLYFPRSSSFFLTFPIKKGDLVLLLFAERSLDNWLAGTGEDTDPDEFRMHDLSDAIALPGLYPFKQAIKDIDTERIALGKDEAGAQIHVAEDHVEITINGSTVKVEGSEGDTKFKVGDGSKHVAIAEYLQQYIIAHTHPSGVGPTGPPTQPWDTKINSSKVSIPDG